MGISSSKTFSEPAPPIEPIRSEFVHRDETTFQIVPMPSDDVDFEVRDNKNNVVLRIDGGTWVHSKHGRDRVRNELNVKDKGDNILFCFRPKKLTLHSTWRLEEECRTGGTAESVATFRRYNTESMGFGAAYRVCRAATQVLRAVESGVWIQKITFKDHASKEVALATRETGSGRYKLTCQPGVDTLLCMLSVIHIDIV